MSSELVVSTSPPMSRDVPATRIYVGDLEYRLVGPRFVKPPLVNTVKMIFNWVTSGARLAKNIWYTLVAGGVDTASPTILKSIANNAMTAFSTAAFAPSISGQWTLQSVTARDNASLSGSQAISDHATIPGGATGPCLPPQCSVVMSWKLNVTYRGGKARWYLPGVPQSAQPASADSGLAAAYAGALAASGTGFLAAFNSMTVGGSPITAGTISYQTSHAARPTPIFRPYTAVEVHERLDSQRRRSGKESAFGELP